MESPLIAGPATEEELAARKAAEALGERFLVFRDDEGRQVIHALERQPPGGDDRAPRRGRHLDPLGPEMSRLHAELELQAGEWTVSDDGLSQNGTWVNGLRLAGRRRLERRRPRARRADADRRTATRCRSAPGRRSCRAS